MLCYYFTYPFGEAERTRGEPDCDNDIESIIESFGLVLSTL